LTAFEVASTSAATRKGCVDLRWHDLRHEGAYRLLADGVDIRIIQLMRGHASIQQTQRYVNVTDEELRRGLEVSWNNKGRRFALRRDADRPRVGARLSP
jgi:site-specific recombinase XerD